MADGKKPALDLSAIGATGLPRWGGYVYDEYLTVLQGTNGRKILREMSEQDSIIGGILFGIEMLARQVPWTVIPANETPRAKKIADFFTECYKDMAPTWEDTISEIFSMLPYGWSWLEMLYKRRDGIQPGNPRRNSLFSDGKIGWRGWAIRGQETLLHWLYEEDENSPMFNELIGMRQQAPPYYKVADIPRRKSLHFVTRSRRQNPEGVSILRNAYRSWYMKKNIEQIEGIGVERDLAGLPVLWAPDNLFAAEANDDEKALLERLKKIVTSIKRDEQEGILMPMAYDDDKNPMYKIELLSTGGDRQFDTSAIVGRYNEGIAMSMLADFILMGHDSVGSYALSDNKTKLLSVALGATLDAMVSEINTNAHPMLTRLNGWPLELTPILHHGDIESANLTVLGDFLKKMADAGMILFPNPVLEKYVLTQAGLPNDPEAEKARAELAAKKAEQDALAQQTAAAGLKALQNPATDPAAPTGANGKPLPKRGERGSASVKAPAPLRPSKAASESKHFVPLSTRMARIAPMLEGMMDPQEYRELLVEVMSAGKWSALDPLTQEVIQAAEEGD